MVEFSDGADQAPEGEEAPITVPIKVSAGLTRAQVLFGIGQAVAAASAIVGFLGLGETTWIVRTVRFLQANEALPVLAVLAWAIVGIALWWRARRRQIERAVMGFLLPNRVAELTGPLHPAVKAAIDEAIKAKLAGTANVRRTDQ